MGDNLTAVALASGDHIIDAVCALGIVLIPLWLILHYIAKFRSGQKLNALDAQAFERVSQTAARMEQRMRALESILDAQVPDWRKTNDSGAGSHETI